MLSSGSKRALLCPTFVGIWVSARRRFYRWRAKYSGMDVSMMSLMKEVEDENRRLKKMKLEEKLKAESVAEAFEKKW
jgi:hypothetical protein